MIARKACLALSLSAVLALGANANDKVVSNTAVIDVEEPVEPTTTVTFSGGAEITFDVGIGSGAFHMPGDPADVFYTITDRGPNIACDDSADILGVAEFCLDNGVPDEDGKIFPVADFAPTIYKFQIDTASSSYQILETITLKNSSGEEITGITNPLTVTNTENSYDNNGDLIDFDPEGLDPEALVRLSDGTFWVAEEYGGSLVRVAADGEIIERVVPEGMEADLAGADYPVSGTLPEIFKKRQLNRGIESIAVSPNEEWLYFIMQSPLANPDSAAYRSSRNVRLVKIALDENGGIDEIVGEYVYYLDRDETFIADNRNSQNRVKVSEMVALDTDELIILERDTAHTKLYKVAQLENATNILGTSWDDEATSPSLEQVDVFAEGNTLEIEVVTKELVFDSLNDADLLAGTLASKIEGIAWLTKDLIALVNDNDFAIVGADSQISVANIGSKLLAPSSQTLSIELISRYTALDENGDQIVDDGAAEIVSFDTTTNRAFVVNSAATTVDVLDMSNPNVLSLIDTIDATALGGGANSVDTKGGLLAVAIENEDSQANGLVAVYDTTTLELVNTYDAGALPDMVTFTPDGDKILVANEGEPNDDYTVDPEGSITIIDLTIGTTATADFNEFDDQIEQLRAVGVRIFGPGASVSQDLEPEYIAVDRYGETAWVSLQENNALAVVDIESATVVDILPLGFKNHLDVRNSMDASNEDRGIHFQNWPTFGMYQPDAIASYEVNGETYIVTANEGDSRDYDGFSEEERVADLSLDYADSFANYDSTLQDDENLGRLKTTNTIGDVDGDGLYEAIYSYGARSFSIWNAEGELVFDSGNDFGLITASAISDRFNGDADELDGDGPGFDYGFDGRSDDKGAEPEAVVVGEVGGQYYAFIGLERTGGIMVYNVTYPKQPQFVTYFVQSTQDVGPEGFDFVHASDSPTGEALLVVGNEISGTTNVYQLESSVFDGELSDLNTAFALLPDGSIEDDYPADFFGGVSVDGAPTEPFAEMGSDQIARIRGGLIGAPQDVGQPVDIVALVFYEEPLSDAGNAFVLTEGGNNIEIWDGTIEGLSAHSRINLQPFQELDVYNGPLPPGEFSFFLGYRTLDDKLVFTLDPVETLVEDTSAAFRMSVIHINDHHSHLEEETIDLEFDGVETRVNFGGFSRVATKINQLRDELPNPLTLHAGDAIVGTLFYTLFKGEPDAAVMNDVGFDAFVLGNHEFDDGNTNLANFLNMLDGIPVLSANIDFSQDDDGLADVVEPFIIREVDGEQVAIFGITTLKTQLSSAPDDETIFEDEVAAASRVAAELETMGIDKIIMLSHFGYHEEQALAQAVDGIDIIIGGDSHTLLGDLIDVGLTTEGPYPTIVISPRGEPVCIAQAWQYSYIVGALEVGFDENGVITDCDGEATLLLGEDFLQRDANGDRQPVNDAVRDRIDDILDSMDDVEIVEQDPEIEAILVGFSEQVDVLTQENIGSASEDLLHIRIPGTHSTGAELPNGSLIAPLVAQGFFFQMESRNLAPDLVIQNAGGVRIDIPAGDISVGDAYTLLPFGNTLFLLEMTGEEVKQSIEDGLANHFDNGGSTGSFPYAFGIRYTIDMNQLSGERVTSLEVMADDGTFSAIDPAALYRVGTNSFQANGGDGYFTMENVAEDRRLDTFFDYAESFVNFVRDEGTISPIAPNLTFIPATQ